MSLIKQIGEQRLAQATEVLYALVLADDDLSPFFEGLNVTQIANRQKMFLRYALGEHSGVSPVNLRQVHAPLIRRGLNHDHFDRLLKHMDTALAEIGIAAELKQSIRARLEQTRIDVLGETYSQFHSKEKTMTGRIGSMLYAVCCYGVGMAVLAYTAGWLGGFLTPTQLDAPGRGHIGIAVLINLLLVGVFAVQHSVMARPAFKAWWTRFVPAQCERATYVLFSSIALMALMWFWQPIGISVWQLQGNAAVAAYTVYACGWFVLVTATFFLNHFELFGLRQAWLNLRGQPYTHIPFKTPGYYRVVRHPIYVGWLLLIWATPAMTVSHLLFALASTAYILIAIPLEERDLANMLPEYKDYQATTPALVPGAGGTAKSVQTA